MNQREPTSAPSGAGQVLPCLALLPLPLLAANRAWSRPILPYAPPPPSTTPYLQAVGSSALRFAEAVPPPDLVMRPAAAAPPHPAEAPPLAHVDVIPFKPEESMPARAPQSDTEKMPPASASEPTSEPSPAPILPDELRPRVRAEDFLPYFQIPASQPGDPNVIVPMPRSTGSPGALPPSSATYTQSPK